jgi:hypothetical protein
VFDRVTLSTSLDHPRRTVRVWQRITTSQVIEHAFGRQCDRILPSADHQTDGSRRLCLTSAAGAAAAMAPNKRGAWPALDAQGGK